MLRRRSAIGLAGLILLLGTFTAGVAVDQAFPEYVPSLILPGQSRSQLDQADLAQALRIVQSHYYDPSVNTAKLTQGSIQGLIQALGDPYSQYLTPAQYTANEQALGGRHNGLIGVYIDFENGLPVITGLIAGSPAQTAGLRAGDVILTIGGTDTKGTTAAQVSTLTTGAPGTVVILHIQRGPGQLDVSVTRENFTSPTVGSTTLPGGILYLRIYSFGTTTATEFDKQLAAGLPGARGAVLDLRNDGGGLVDAARAVISRFVATGEAFEVRSRDGVTQRTNVEGEHPAADLPLVVLVNASTASAAEIVSGSLQTRGRARLVGVTTFGKGSAQQDFPLPDGGDLHLTVEHWFLPGGRSIDHVGLTPDVAATLPGESAMFDVVEPELGHVADAQLNQALALLGAA